MTRRVQRRLGVAPADAYRAAIRVQQRNLRRWQAEGDTRLVRQAEKEIEKHRAALEAMGEPAEDPNPPPPVQSRSTDIAQHYRDALAFHKSEIERLKAQPWNNQALIERHRAEITRYEADLARRDRLPIKRFKAMDTAARKRELKRLRDEYIDSTKRVTAALDSGDEDERAAATADMERAGAILRETEQVAESLHAPAESVPRREPVQKKLPFDPEVYRRVAPPEPEEPEQPDVEVADEDLIGEDAAKGSIRCMTLRKKGIRIRRCEHNGYTEFRAYDGSGDIVGVVKVGDAYEGGTTDVAYSEVSPSHRMDKVGTALYEAAAAFACENNSRLASDETRSEFSEAFWRKQARKRRASCIQDNDPEEDVEPDLDEIEAAYGSDVADDMGYDSVAEAVEDDPDEYYSRLYKIQENETERGEAVTNYYSSPRAALESRRRQGLIDDDEYDAIVDRLPEPEEASGGFYWPCLQWGIDEDACDETMDLGKVKKRRCRTGKCGTAGAASLPPKPRGLKVKWTRTVAKNHARVRDRCLASKPKCTTKYTAGKRVRKCWRECEELATRTVNRAKRTAAAAKKKSGRKKTARA